MMCRNEALRQAATDCRQSEDRYDNLRFLSSSALGNAPLSDLRSSLSGATGRPATGGT
jgi:hypothetical protein